ncbi:hypothetical protein ACFW04_010955 [Cataglyphis niger]
MYAREVAGCYRDCVLSRCEMLPDKRRSKRKRRKSHSVQRRAIDRGDEARSAICTRDRPLRRISRTHARTHSLGLGVCVCVCVCIRA